MNLRQCNVAVTAAPFMTSRAKGFCSSVPTCLECFGHVHRCLQQLQDEGHACAHISAITHSNACTTAASATLCKLGMQARLSLEAGVAAGCAPPGTRAPCCCVRGLRGQGHLSMWLQLGPRRGARPPPRSHAVAAASTITCRLHLCLLCVASGQEGLQGQQGHRRLRPALRRLKLPQGINAPAGPPAHYAWKQLV